MREISWLCVAAILLTECSSPRPPATPRVPVTDTYHGVPVVDDYRWLEDWSSSEVRAWSEAQNAYARSVLDRLPAVDRIRERVGEILRAESDSYSALSWTAGALFAIKREPPKEQPFLVVLGSADDPRSARTIVDPNATGAGAHVTIDWYRPSPDGKLVAVSLSRDGSQSGDLQVYDVTSGEPVEAAIPRVHGGTAGGDAAWARDGEGFYYTRYPRPGERPAEQLEAYQQVWFHRLGDAPENDRYELGDGLPSVAELRLQAGPASDRVLATMQDGDSDRFEHYLRSPDGSWERIARYEDEIVQAAFAPDGALILISQKDAPRGKLLRLPPTRLALAAAQVIVAEGSDTLVHDFYDEPPVVATSSRIFATVQLGGPSAIRVFDFAGEPQPAPDVLPVSRVGQIVALAGDEILYSNESFLEPQAWYRFAGGETRRTALATESPADFADTEVVRETAESADGTAVPVSILRRRGIELDGTHPTLATGYGGFSVSLEPKFQASRRVWIEQGGVVAVANLRGGGELGEAWHRQGMLTAKQNVFDDFAAVMRHLIARRYTSPRLLALRGASNGGLLMGAALTQHPETPRAVVARVGLYDMLRVELSANGAFNIPEYGTVADPEQFRALHAYSPYHNVSDGTAYPAVLFMTGDNDPRVDPMQSRKMTARLQAATSSGQPILLRTSADTGHGSGTPLSEAIEELSHEYAFLFDQLGVAYRPVDAAAAGSTTP